jgi:hypothetical protein
MNVTFKKALIFVVTGLCCIVVSKAFASPPATTRNDVSMFLSAGAVVEAMVIKSRKWTEGIHTVHLVAKYRVRDVFKGDIRKDDIVIVTDTCLDKPVPEEEFGYPGVKDYCMGGMNINLTGVRKKDGSPVYRPKGTQGWILFLKLDRRPGAPQQTWLELSRTSFWGGGRRTRNDIPKGERGMFDRMLKRMNYYPERNKSTY